MRNRINLFTIKKMIKGSTRYVFFIGKYAFKIPSFYSYDNFLLGLLANRNEVRFSKINHVFYRKRLCPIKFYLPLGLLVVMPRCKPITTLSDETFEMFTKSLEGYSIPCENKLSSFGILSQISGFNNVVCVDYGDICNVTMTDVELIKSANENCILYKSNDGIQMYMFDLTGLRKLINNN